MTTDYLKIALPHWQRGVRSRLVLPLAKGVYALFLNEHSSIPGLELIKRGEPLYVGKAGGRSGIKGRCHFKGRTVTHSPRRSLAALLRSTLDLSLRPGTACHKWGLTSDSEAVLDGWMHTNLEMAFCNCDNEAEVKQALLSRYSPLLNLSGCDPTPWRKRLGELRAKCCQDAHTGGAS